MQFKDQIDITMVNGDACPFQLTLGNELGTFYQKQHEENGVKVINKCFIKSVNSKEDGNVQSISLPDGSDLEADLVIVGTGVRPATTYLRESGIDMNKDGGIVCDPFLQTSVKDIYAAGDLVSYPYWPTGSRTRTEHWVVALDQGTNAAFNMLGKFEPYQQIPFFWTRHYIGYKSDAALTSRHAPLQTAEFADEHPAEQIRWPAFFFKEKLHRFL